MTFFDALADSVLIIHGVYVAFVVAGGVAALWWRHIIWIHVPAVVWAALVELKGWICPLTPLENWLRCQAGDAGYAGGFVEHYLAPLLYPVGLTREMQVFLGMSVLLGNGAVYWWVLHWGMNRSERRRV
ncbi:MAG: DUF2784 domain-containing protein [Deltaproteobacteria bacterium]|nr:DUF2784 domain-containing protein [Deltaproteobacteria bacterium]